jgi:hypothetical protein
MLTLAQHETLHWSDWLWPVALPALPVLLMILVFPLFFRFLMPYIRKHSGMEQYIERFDRIEVQLRRIADALEKSDRDQPGHSK